MPRPGIIERFWSKVDLRGPSECWEWRGTRLPKGGHGNFYLGHRRPAMRAHRFSALLHFGPFDRRLLVLHHCDNAACVNPSHLYLGSHDDNMRDMRTRGRAKNMNMDKTHCIHGHEFTPENTRIRKSGWRVCKKCDVRHAVRYKQIKRGKLRILGSVD